MSFPKVLICGAVRTPIGAIGGTLAPMQAQQLAVESMKALLDKTGADPTKVDYTCVGWVMQDPRSPNLAKTAAELAGVPHTSPGTTFHENCASGGAAIHSMARRIMLGEVELGIAGGVESMSNVARYLYKGRMKGQLYGDMTIVDGLMGALTDTNVGPKGELMGLLTERLTDKYGLVRAEHDQVAFDSHRNALAAWDGGYFDDYVVPVTIPKRRGEPTVFARDEGPKAITLEKLASARPYFKADGTITGANASTLNDGAAMVLLATEARAAELGLTPLAELKAFHNVGVRREYMGEGAFKVILPMLGKAGLGVGDIDFFELNEAFAAVVAAAYKDIEGLDSSKVNQWGSGISLGHPVGCTGARQVVDMVHQLGRRGGRVGLVSRCVGGGIGSGEIVVKL